MSNHHIRVASVGLGRWAGFTAEGVQRVPELKIVGCFTRSEERKRAFAEKYNCRPYPSYEAIVDDSDIDAVLITTPHSVHLPQVLAAAQAGKHIFVEKPLAVTVEDAEKAIEECDRAGVTLMVGHCWRWLGPVQRVRSMLESGELGQLTQAVGHFGNALAQNFGQEIWRDDPKESSAGPFTGPGFHLLDILYYLLGPVKEVLAVFERHLDRNRIVDTAVASLNFKSGVLAQVSSSIISPRSYLLSLFGTEANAHLNLEREGESHAQPAFVLQRSGGSESQVVPVPEVDMIAHQMSAFAESVLTGTRPVTGGEDGLALVRLLAALSESAAARKWVSL